MKISVNSFVNPHGQEVSQVFVGSLPITTEMEHSRALAYAYEEFDRLYSDSVLVEWDDQNGEREITRK